MVYRVIDIMTIKWALCAYHGNSQKTNHYSEDTYAHRENWPTETLNLMILMGLIASIVDDKHPAAKIFRIKVSKV